ncbi:P-loop NTPase fold protein [Candidatus Avelusimicrobium sp.]|uniref:P-loop NTPase fold protein n=1 Tax=Candidatus Avelusimicrobium sp. TaxID=3048833 RepID=UPI003D7F032E
MERIIHPIVPAIEEFLKIPCKDLALLIYGPWGCGKTFFLDIYLKKNGMGKKQFLFH